MRLAVLGDIHGNPRALEAVLDDITAHGSPDAYWLTGDYAALGCDPVGALERIAALPNAVYVRGNTDRYTISGDRPPPSLDDAHGDPAEIWRVINIAESFAWTRGAVTGGASGADWFGWLAALPTERRLTLPDGTRLLMVHAAPGRDDGPGLTIASTDDEIAAMLDGCEADLVLVGHTHWPVDRTVNGVRMVNVGSVSNPPAPDLRASYMLLDADDSGYQLTFRRVEYDMQPVIDALRAVHHPAEAFLLSFLEGRWRPEWVALLDS